MQNLQKKKINALLTSLVIFVSVVCVGIVFLPSLMGLKAYSVETGSMAPIIPEGSMVYVKPCNSSDEYVEGDVVTFTDPLTGKSFTHRVIQVDSANREFITKGDANEEPDLKPTAFELAVGKVQLSIPLLGYAASFLKSTVVKIAVAVIYIAWAAIEIEIYLTERKKKYD